MPIRAFAFDLDETLVDCEPHHELATEAMMTATGVPAEIVHRVFSDVTGKRTRDIVEAFRVAADTPHSLDDLLKVRHEGFRVALQRAPPAPLPGASELLHQCSAYGPVALVTSGHQEDAMATIDALGFRHLFDAFVTGEDVENPKPHPEPYVKAAAALGVPPQAMMAFEDSGRGVSAAKAAGCRIVAVPNPRNTPRSAVAHADLVVDSMTELLPLDALLARWS